MNKSLLAELESTKSLLQTVLINTQEKEKELISLKEQILQSKELLQEKEIQDQESKKEIDNYKRKERQFERVIHFLRKRLEEAHLENKELFSAFQKVQMRHHELEYVLQTKEKQKQELEDELMALRHFKQEHELDKEAPIENQQKLLEEQVSFLEITRKDFNILKRELGFSLQEHRQETFDSKNQLSLKIDEMQKKLDKHKGPADETLSLSQTLTKWQKKVHEVPVEGENLRLIYQELEGLRADYKQIHQDPQMLATSYSKSENSTKEIEAALSAAQQHLAQKVKEARLFIEENGFLKEEIQKLKIAITAADSKNIDNQNSFEIEWSHQKRPQEQYSDSLASFESPSFRWKEKRLYMQKKWQKAETKVNEYKQFEAKPQKMHTISKHLSNLLETSLVLHSTPCQNRSLKHLIVKIDKPLQINQPTFFGLGNTSTKVKTFIK